MNLRILLQAPSRIIRRRSFDPCVCCMPPIETVCCIDPLNPLCGCLTSRDNRDVGALYSCNPRSHRELLGKCYSSPSSSWYRSGWQRTELSARLPGRRRSKVLPKPDLRPITRHQAYAGLNVQFLRGKRFRAKVKLMLCCLPRASMFVIAAPTIGWVYTASGRRARCATGSAAGRSVP